MDFAFNAPYYWTDELAEKDPENNFINTDMCVISGRDFFVRGVIEIPVLDNDETFNWGVWVSLSKENFKRYFEVYGTQDELREKPYFGWLSNEIPIYPKTLNIKTHVRLQGNTLRPKSSLIIQTTIHYVKSSILVSVWLGYMRLLKLWNGLARQ